MTTPKLASARVETAQLVLQSFTESASEAWDADFIACLSRVSRSEITSLLLHAACAGDALHQLLTDLVGSADNATPNVIKAASAVLAAVNQLTVAAEATAGHLARPDLVDSDTFPAVA
jgi:hypothetical protein